MSNSVEPEKTPFAIEVLQTGLTLDEMLGKHGDHVDPFKRVIDPLTSAEYAE